MTNEQRELVDQLRYRPVATTAAQMREAAATIEQLAERCGRLEAALRLAEFARDYNGDMLNISRLRCGRLEACVLEYWHAKDWAAVGAADSTAAKLLPADMKARAALKATP